MVYACISPEYPTGCYFVIQPKNHLLTNLKPNGVAVIVPPGLVNEWYNAHRVESLCPLVEALDFVSTGLNRYQSLTYESGFERTVYSRIPATQFIPLDPISLANADFGIQSNRRLSL